MASSRARSSDMLRTSERSVYGRCRPKKIKLTATQQGALDALKAKTTVTFVSNRGSVRSAEAPQPISAFRMLESLRLARSDWTTPTTCVFTYRPPPAAQEDSCPSLP